MLSLLLCCMIAACDAASGPHLILIGLLITGPCCALLTGRWVPTAVASCFALALGVVLGVPDQIFATVTQYAFMSACRGGRPDRDGERCDPATPASLTAGAAAVTAE